jgi:hypothetical protein
LGARSYHKELAKEKESNAAGFRDGSRPCQGSSNGIQQIHQGAR